MESERKITALRDASFSSYLTSTDDNIVRKLTEPLQETSGFKSSMPEEGEISIFSAEKYFKMKLDDQSHRVIDPNPVRHIHAKEITRVDHGMRMKGRPGTRSAISEVSWNSQTALSPSSMNSFSRSRQKKVNERWLFAVFPCSGLCLDKKSVYTDSRVVDRGIHGKDFRKEIITPAACNPATLGGKGLQSPSSFHVSSNQSSEKTIIGSNREEYFVLPTVNSGVQSLKVIREYQKVQEEEPRKSIEVFGSRLMRKEDITMNLERKLSVLTWDAIPKSQSIATTSTISQVYDELESDASSDLFEIENISGAGQPKLTKQTSYGMSDCMTPTSRYEPSEASIEWSVVTASAADFSIVSDYDEKKVAENKPTSGLASTARKSRTNGLLSCKNQRAVKVAETASKRNDKARPTRARKLETETKVKDFDLL
ncbi:hypothetical protein K2173_019689 [Erythroxylum novogranatense]|uniref:Protein PHYTOCHROME KINASE SUBSTRATE 1-like n=1 Tax=Erythroxylum novogranatense TaxID=1862640 RepID=A0AAV8SMN5_9ROSI|nr:hypothetical protein K2173_019689 [Erythroxylum novogranatense]